MEMSYNMTEWLDTSLSRSRAVIVPRTNLIITIVLVLLLLTKNVNKHVPLIILKDGTSLPNNLTEHSVGVTHTQSTPTL